MEKSYQRRGVLAEQFIAGTTPWPDGVNAVDNVFAPYEFVNEFGQRFQLVDGDYIKRTLAGRIVVSRAEFENQYEEQI